MADRETKRSARKDKLSKNPKVEEPDKTDRKPVEVAGNTFKDPARSNRSVKKEEKKAEPPKKSDVEVESVESGKEPAKPETRRSKEKNTTEVTKDVSFKKSQPSVATGDPKGDSMYKSQTLFSSMKPGYQRSNPYSSNVYTSNVGGYGSSYRPDMRKSHHVDMTHGELSYFSLDQANAGMYKSHMMLHHDPFAPINMSSN